MEKFNIILLIVTLIGVAISLLFMFYIIKKSSTLLPIEIGKKKKVTIRCGGDFKKASMSKPFARLSIYDSFIVVRYYREAIVKNIDEIVKIRDISSIVSKGVEILTKGNSDSSIKLYNIRYSLFKKHITDKNIIFEDKKKRKFLWF